MSSSKDIESLTGDDIIIFGHVKKRSTMTSASLKPERKKFFVLRGDNNGQSARIEYWDSKKKCINKQASKRCIILKSCFDIKQRDDGKYKHAITIFTKQDSLSMIFDNQKELIEWLRPMQELFGIVKDGEEPRPTFEHVWHVALQKKGLGEKQNLHGPSRLCLTDRTLSLIKIGPEENPNSLEFPLTTIRRCGFMDRIFYMEVGRSAMTGEGDYWMKAEDSNIASNMHSTIMNAMTKSKEREGDDLLPQGRKRSSSANDASKPISVISRRGTCSKLHGFSPLGATIRDRCDSLPSRARTTSEGLASLPVPGHFRNAHLIPHTTRPQSMMYSRGLSYSPPVSSIPLSPASCSTDSAGSSLSMDDGNCDIIEESSSTARYGLSLTPDEPVIFEENGDDYAPWSTDNNQTQKYSLNFKPHSPSQQSSYVEMHSPSNSSPGQGPLSSYIQMNPATTTTTTHHSSHSRTSSLVEEMTLPDGYVPMAPVGVSSYVDMERSCGHNNGHYSDDMSQHGSTCSVTSGTPSTDSRLIGYSLDKVTSFFHPTDDLRPTRAYSVGSRQEQLRFNNRHEPINNDTSRVRAFSVGSRSKNHELSRLQNIIMMKKQMSIENINTSKSNSAPLLSSSWGHNSVCSDRLDDLMEIDFTNKKSSITTAAITTITTATTTTTTTTIMSQVNTNTAIDLSSYVDMTPGQSCSNTMTTTAPYVDMSGAMKANRNNNNNNIFTANHNHQTMIITPTITTPITTPSSTIYKPIIQTLKPVVESESFYCQMKNSPNEFTQIETTSKQPRDNYKGMNGPPGVMRSPPVDLPQPRKPPDGYVEMSFKARPSLEQDYINMTTGNITKCRQKHRPGSKKDRSHRSNSITSQVSTKYKKHKCFLPLNGNNSTAESADSTPASTPQAITTPTGSNTTIFPFSLNSPQSPIKSYNIDDKSAPSSSDCSPDIGDYATMTPGRHPLTAVSSPIPINLSDKKIIDRPLSPVKKIIVKPMSTNYSPQQQKKNVNDLSLSPLTKKIGEFTIGTKKKVGKKTTSPVTISATSPITVTKDDNNLKLINDTSKIVNCDKPSSPTSREFIKNSQELLQSPVTKKLSELSITKTKLIGSSPNTSPTSIGGLKLLSGKSSLGAKINDDCLGTIMPVSPTSPSSPASSSVMNITGSTNQIDSDGYEKLQPGASLLHYASLDLPESSSIPPVSPTPVQDGFKYAEIDFAKLKQN